MANLFSKLLGAVGIDTNADEEFEEYETPTRTDTKVSHFPGKRGKEISVNTTTQFNVVVIQPEGFDESREIADHLKNHKPVVINLELLDKDAAHKTFDFLSGATYALGGSIQKISSNIYMIAPYNVTILGDFKDEITNNSFLWNI